MRSARTSLHGCTRGKVNTSHQRAKTHTMSSICLLLLLLLLLSCSANTRPCVIGRKALVICPSHPLTFHTHNSVPQALARVESRVAKKKKENDSN